MYTTLPFEYLLNKTLSAIEVGEHEIIFTLENGEKFILFHEQNCCENVYVEDISGDVRDLIGQPILLAEEVSNSEDAPPDDGRYVESYTWTFYKLSTNLGSVTIRFFGSSNGYYSERVTFAVYDESSHSFE